MTRLKPWAQTTNLHGENEMSMKVIIPRYKYYTEESKIII